MSLSFDLFVPIVFFCGDVPIVVDFLCYSARVCIPFDLNPVSVPRSLRNALT
jgi:hypothetical protein